jgi:uncharacterized membrane protein
MATERIGVEEQISGEETSAGRRTESGINENVMGALSYVLGFVTGIIVYLIERDNEYVRFHAAQSIAVFGLLFVANVALSTVSATLFTSFAVSSVGSGVVFGLLSLVLSLASLAFGLGALVAWVYLMVRAYQGETPRVPIAAGLADRLV